MADPVAKRERAFMAWYGRNLSHWTPNFVPRELLIGGVPPERIWWNCALPILFLQKIRDHFGKPLVITSAYRAPKHNELVGGAPESQHQLFDAFDFAVAGVRPDEVARLIISGNFEIEIPEGWTQLQAYEATVRTPIWERVSPRNFMPNYLLAHEGASKANRLSHIGGLGLYASWVHLDCRGIEAFWNDSPWSLI